MNDLHQILPWFMNGTLDSSERASFEFHLAECKACRDEMSVIEDLRRELRHPDWDLMAEHPSPQTLAEVSIDGVDDAGTRRHLAVCLTCAEEVLWLKGEAACGRVPRPSRRPVSRWVVRASLAAAVTVLVVAAGIFMFPRRPGHTTGLFQVDLIPSSERSRADHPVVRVPGEMDDVHLMFEVDLGPEQYPFSFQLLDSSSHAVLTIERLDAGALYRGAFLFVVCNRNDCPDGDYSGHVSPAGGGVADIEYPFRLITVP